MHLNEAVDTSWVLKKIWPVVSSYTRKRVEDMIIIIQKHLIEVKRKELGFHPKFNNETHFRTQHPRKKWTHKNFKPDSLKNWDWVEEFDRNIDSFISIRGPYLFREVSRRVTKYIQAYIKQTYGPTFMFHNKQYNVEDIYVRFQLVKDPKHGGEVKSIKDINIYIDIEDFTDLIKQFVHNVTDDEIDFRNEFDKGFRDTALEPFAHELVHVEQIIRSSNKVQQPGQDYVGVDLSYLPSKEGRGGYEHDSERYHGFRNEIDAFATATATRMVKEFTRGLDHEKQQQEWNAAIDRALDTLKQNYLSSQISWHFNTLKNTLTRYATNNNIPQKYLDSIWKRFLKLTYIHIQSHKV